MVPSFGFKLPLTIWYSLCISSEVPLDFTKGGVQGKRRRLESAVTHHPFHSQPPELIRPNLEYCENLNQLSFEICQDPELLFGRKINKSGPILNFQPGSKMRQIILQFLHDMEFPLPAGIDISKGLPPPVNDNVKICGKYLHYGVVLHSYLPKRTPNIFLGITNAYFKALRDLYGEIYYVSPLRFQSLDDPTGLQAMDASNTTSIVWIFTGLNWELAKQLQCFGCSKVLTKIHTSNPKNKLLNELIATDSFSVFRPGGEFLDWFDTLVVSKGSILSFVVPSLVKQEIRGWFLCAVFASNFHDIHGFTVSYKFKNKTKGINWQYQQKNSRVIPCQEHMWLQFVPLHRMPHLLEAGDEVEYSIRISGGFEVKKFGVNVIYENDKKDCHSYFEAMVKNASLPYKDDFLDEDVSTNQPMAGDKKINPFDLQKSRFDDKQKGIATSLDASKHGCLSARETTQQQWDEELAAHLQDKEEFKVHLSLQNPFECMIVASGWAAEVFYHVDSFSFFCPGVEFLDWFDALVVSKGSILSFVVPSLVKQEIRGWFLCAVFASSFHDIHEFTVSYKFKNKTKGIDWQYQQKNSRVIPCQEHMWLQFVPLHRMPHPLEAGDEVEYSIRISGGFEVKKFGVNIIYENDKKDCHSYFEAMVKNASLLYKDDFLDEDVSTNQLMAGDKKINPFDLQKSRFDDKKKKIATFLDASKRGCLSTRETTQQQWDEELAAHLQYKEDVSIAQHYELAAMILEDPTVVLEDHNALVEAEDGLSEGDRKRSWSDFQENQSGTTVFEGGAAFELNMYSSGIPRMNFVSRTMRLRSLEAERMSWEVERQILHHQNAALERENFRLRMQLANARQFAPQLHMGLPRPHLAFERASSSASASIQTTIAATTPVASARTNTPGLDYPNFLARPVLGFQSVNNPSGSSPPNGGSHLPQ
nr:hypothetical protein CFP56_49990 [Quercus suber]